MFINCLDCLFNKTSFHLLATLTIIFFVCIPAFAQMGGGSSYSDMWIEYGGGDTVTVWGSSVYEDQYNTYGHTYTVNATISSNSGANGSGSNSGGSYTVVDVYLTSNILDGLDEYITLDAENWTYCPIANQTYLASTGGTAVSGTAYQAAYRYLYMDSGYWVYGPTCIASGGCTRPKSYESVDFGPYTECPGKYYQVPILGKVCIDKCHGVAAEGTCK